MSVRKKLVKLPTFGKGGIMPGVNLDDSAALLDLMERDDGCMSACLFSRRKQGDKRKKRHQESLRPQ